MKYKFDNTITFEDYTALREAVGWRKISKRQFELGLKNAHYIAVVKNDNNRGIGIIKGLGDGGYYWLLSDLIVHPDYQGLGFGRKLVEGFLKHVDVSAEKGENLHITLASSKGKEPFYEKFGFKTRPFAEGIQGAGMSMNYEKI
ncbi:MAG: GNAT family N-acetyltransferase [Oscillospiraceae bacterium]|nr:GNAT family N-acetyltransferase [Oscillospiraceae bacterium]